MLLTHDGYRRLQRFPLITDRDTTSSHIPALDLRKAAGTHTSIYEHFLDGDVFPPQTPARYLLLLPLLDLESRELHFFLSEDKHEVDNLVKPLQTEAIIGEMFLRQTWTRELTTERNSLLTDVTGHAPRASRLSLILPDATYHTTSVNRD